MRCPRCRSMMYEKRVESAHQSRQTWYQCDTCGQAKLYSQPFPLTLDSPQSALGALQYTGHRQYRG